MVNRKSTYPLLPYSQLVFDMTRWMPAVYSFPSTLRWRGGAAQQKRIEETFGRVLRKHPVFSSRVDWRGRQQPAELKDIFHGQYHGVDFYVKGEDLYIRLWGNRILGDGKSGQILLQDLFRAYSNLPLEQDDYWGYVAAFERSKTEPHYRISQDWLVKEFADDSVPVRPTMDRWTVATLLPPKAGLYTSPYSDWQERIHTFTKRTFLPMDGFFSLCTALAIADYCGTDEAALTWAYEGREKPSEQRVIGSLHRDIPFQISRMSKTDPLKHASREELIREARAGIRTGIAHSDYPYTLTHPYTKRWNYAVNVLRVDDEEDTLSQYGLPLEIVSVPPQKYAYALLDVEIHEHLDTLALWFRYSATHYKEPSIRRFASLIRKYAEWLLQ